MHGMCTKGWRRESERVTGEGPSSLEDSQRKARTSQGLH